MSEKHIQKLNPLLISLNDDSVFIIPCEKEFKLKI